MKRQFAVSVCMCVFFIYRKNDKKLLFVNDDGDDDDVYDRSILFCMLENECVCAWSLAKGSVPYYYRHIILDATGHIFRINLFWENTRYFDTCVCLFVCFYMYCVCMEGFYIFEGIFILCNLHEVLHQIYFGRFRWLTL